MNKANLRWDFWTGVTILSIVVFGLFLIYPLFSLFISAFQEALTGAFNREHFELFLDRRYHVPSVFDSYSVTPCVQMHHTVLVTTIA